MDSVTWACKRFDELSRDELYAVLKLRSEVFVVEQKMIFLDLDGKDQTARHVLGVMGDGQLVAYARLFEKGIIYPEYHCIGRVVTFPLWRNLGIGKALVGESIRNCHTHFDSKTPIKLGAQLYLKTFYERLGFTVCGSVYLDGDNVDHVPMVLKVA